MIKAFAFDLDGTLTQHKTPLDGKNRAILEKLAERYTLIMVGAGSYMRIHNQLEGFPMDIIGNYGMQYAKYTGDGLVLVRDDSLVGAERNVVEERINTLRQKYGFTEYAGNNVEYHASGCLTFPILGTKAVQEDKLAFDPDRSKRRAIYDEVCNTFPEYNVFVGGSSSFDMAPKPFNKYYALDLWCRENGLDHSEVVFVGDDYGLGGNDESVYRSDFRFVTTDDYTRFCEVMAPFVDSSVPDIEGLIHEHGGAQGYALKTAVIRVGALNELTALCSDYKSILLIRDESGEYVGKLLGNKVTSEITYSSDGFAVPDEAAVGSAESGLTDGTDLIVGVGAGGTDSLCKYLSAKHGVPYISVATAPSTDGYATMLAKVRIADEEVTVSATTPVAIVADVAVLKEAPLELIRSGLECIADRSRDFEVACGNEYSELFSAVMDAESDILLRDENAIASLMRALVVLGIAKSCEGK